MNKNGFINTGSKATSEAIPFGSLPVVHAAYAAVTHSETKHIDLAGPEKRFTKNTKVSINFSSLRQSPSEHSLC